MRFLHGKNEGRCRSFKITRPGAFCKGQFRWAKYKVRRAKSEVRNRVRKYEERSTKYEVRNQLLPPFSLLLLRTSLFALRTLYFAFVLPYSAIAHFASRRCLSKNPITTGRRSRCLGCRWKVCGAPSTSTSSCT